MDNRMKKVPYTTNRSFRRKNRENVRAAVFNDIIAKNFSKLMRDGFKMHNKSSAEYIQVKQPHYGKISKRKRAS